MPRILVIDDSRSALEVVAHLLREGGHEVVPCLESKLALERLGAERFDLVVTDIFMPDNDGLEVIMKHRRTGSRVPVIAYSGVTNSKPILKMARVLGACRVLEKSRLTHELLDAVAEALGPNRLSRSGSTAGKSQ